MAKFDDLYCYECKEDVSPTVQVWHKELGGTNVEVEVIAWCLMCHATLLSTTTVVDLNQGFSDAGN